MRIGIDVGGTNTDAVLVEGATVLAEVKVVTTSDVTAGVVDALAGLKATHDFDRSRIQAVMIGTTHFTNAIVECRGLMQTAVVRLALPATGALPPMVDWPVRLSEALGNHTFMCHGGHEFDGREISPLDESEIRRVAEQIASQGIKSVAISSVFSPVNAEFEQRAAALFVEQNPDLYLSLSHEIGRIGLLERENATVINACLRGLADQISGSLLDAVQRAGIDAPLYLSQNDGTVMDLDYARRYPVATFASGPTNSMRGAAALSGVTDGVVVDIGGTTTDVGVLTHGYPREATTMVDMAGVRTNFRMPDVISVGIGGGSRVREGDGVTVGPDSVGYQLTSKALVFGGDTLTATDIAVAAGIADVGDASLVRHLSASTVHDGTEAIIDKVTETIDRIRTSAESIPVILVGGGSVLLPERFPGFDEVYRPDHHAVANAVGAAIAQVGGEVDRVFSLSKMSRDEALDEARNEAVANAIAAGATRTGVEIVEIDEVPLSYLPGNAVRIRIKAVGDLELADKETARP